MKMKILGIIILMRFSIRYIHLLQDEYDRTMEQEENKNTMVIVTKERTIEQL